MTTYYLYVKTHNITGLKYLGVTLRNDPFKYRGTGVYWRYHIKKHGYDVTTKILLKTTCKDILKLMGIYFSNCWNIVESDEWANLMKETGDGSGEKSKETRLKLSKANLGKKVSKETRFKISNNKKGQKAWNLGKSPSESTKKKMSDSKKGKDPWNKGKTYSFTEENCNKNYETRRGKPTWNKGLELSDDYRKKLSEAHKGNIPWNKGKKGIPWSEARRQAQINKNNSIKT